VTLRVAAVRTLHASVAGGPQMALATA